ncbi:hypothetical protein AGMMS50239_37510 [Bacteroidia bacterium]|nr:hypothetical protein AGMMS50239_37510 [Bacteroidia bacterium]
MVHNSICGILEDEANGDIWVAALTGISKINLQSRKIINYTRKTGFPLQEVSRKAFLKGSDGLFYIGGSNGLVSFDPNTFKAGFSKSPVVRISLIKSLNTKNDSQQPGFDNYVDMNKKEANMNINWRVPIWIGNITTAASLIIPTSDMAFPCFAAKPEQVTNCPILIII